MSTASDDNDLVEETMVMEETMVEALSDTEESASRADTHDNDETSTAVGDDDDEESTFVGGGDLLREILRDLSVSFDTTKSSNSNNNSKVSSGDGDDTEEGETEQKGSSTSSSSSSTLSNDEYNNDAHISEEEELQNEKELVEEILANAMRTGKEPDVIRPPQCKDRKVVFAKKKTVRSTIAVEEVRAEPEPEATVGKEDEPPLVEKSAVETSATTAIVPATTTPFETTSSSYLPCILNLWKCTDEKNMEEELHQQQTPLGLIPALDLRENRRSGMAHSEKEKVYETAMLQTSGSMKQMEEQSAPINGAVVEAEKPVSLTSLRKLAMPHQEKGRNNRSRGGLSKTYSMPVDIPDDEVDPAIRAVRSHEVIQRRLSVDGAMESSPTAEEARPKDNQVNSNAAEAKHDDNAVKVEKDSNDDVEEVEDSEPITQSSKSEGSGRLRNFSSSTSNNMIDSVRSSASWVKTTMPPENLRPAKSLDDYMKHNSILLAHDHDFIIKDLAVKEEDGNNFKTNLNTETNQKNQVSDDKVNVTEQTEAKVARALTQKGSKMITKSTMSRLKKKIQGLTKGKQGEAREPSSLLFSAGQQQVHQRKPKRNKHSIFRSLAKFVKSQPLGLAVIEENPELETREAHGEAMSPVSSAQGETLKQTSNKTTIAAPEVKDGELHYRNVANVMDTVTAIAGTMSQNMTEHISETRSGFSEPSVADDARLCNTITPDPDDLSQGESETISENESETNTDTDTNSSDDWASTDEVQSVSTRKDSIEAPASLYTSVNCTKEEIGDEIEGEMGTEIALMPKGYGTDIELVDSDGDLVIAVDIGALSEPNTGSIQEQIIPEKENRYFQLPQEHVGVKKGKKGTFRIQALLSDLKKKTTRKAGTANIEVDPEALQMKSWVENEHQKGSRLTSLMAPPSSPRPSTRGAEYSIEKQKTWTGMSSNLSMVSATEKKNGSTARKTFEAPSTKLCPAIAPPSEDERDDNAGNLPSSGRHIAETADEERTGLATEPETDKTDPYGRRFFSRMLSNSSLAAEDRHKDPVPECLEHTLKSYDQGCPQSSSPKLPDIPFESLRKAIDLQRWRSVEQKIDASLKKAAALANNYDGDLALTNHDGGDLADIIPASASYSSYASSSVAISTATSYASEMVSVAEAKPDDWRNVGRKIDDSISKVEKLAIRLGLDKKRGKLHSE